MSIIMKAGNSQQAPSTVCPPSPLDAPVRDLLDHIAVELAAEYVRLMEAAANDEALSPTDT